MFANTYQSGFISVFYSVGSSPLQLWEKQVKNGHIRRVVDDEVRSLVLEISGTNVATTYITCPIKPRMSLGVKLPFLVMIIKNMKKYFTFEIQILDDKDMHRRFRVSNFQSTTKVRPFCTTMPIGLSSGWNQIQFNLADFTKRAYGSTYLETTRVQIHANVRIRRIYFADQLYSDDELPNEYKLFLPTSGKPEKQKKPGDKDVKAAEEPKTDKKLSLEELVIQEVEEEMPSAAPPTPAGPAMEEAEVPPELINALEQAEEAAPEEVPAVAEEEGGEPKAAEEEVTAPPASEDGEAAPPEAAEPGAGEPVTEGEAAPAPETDEAGGNAEEMGGEHADLAEKITAGDEVNISEEVAPSIEHAEVQPEAEPVVVEAEPEVVE